MWNAYVRTLQLWSSDMWVLHFFLSDTHSLTHSLTIMNNKSKTYLSKIIFFVCVKFRCICIPPFILLFLAERIFFYLLFAFLDNETSRKGISKIKENTFWKDKISWPLFKRDAKKKKKIKWQNWLHWKLTLITQNCN